MCYNNTPLPSPTINHSFEKLCKLTLLHKHGISVLRPFLRFLTCYSYAHSGPTVHLTKHQTLTVVYLSWRKTLGCTSQQRPLCVGPSQGAPWSERCGLPTTTYITEGTGTVQHYSMHTHVNTSGCPGLTHTAASERCRDTLAAVVGNFLRLVS